MVSPLQVCMENVSGEVLAWEHLYESSVASVYGKSSVEIACVTSAQLYGEHSYKYVF